MPSYPRRQVFRIAGVPTFAIAPAASPAEATDAKTGVLNPSDAIEPRFVNYVVTTKDGRILDGILANETPGSITLRNADADETILRKNIAQIRASRLSLMPDGLEKNVSKQALADLIAYLRGGL